MPSTDRPEGYTGEIITSKTKAIKVKCMDCCCGSYIEVKGCSVTDCALWPFRLGKNPYSTRGHNMTEEQRAAVAERFRKLREE